MKKKDLPGFSWTLLDFWGFHLDFTWTLPGLYLDLTWTVLDSDLESGCHILVHILYHRKIS
jgi:hypothetical protein